MELSIKWWQKILGKGNLKNPRNKQIFKILSKQWSAASIDINRGNFVVLTLSSMKYKSDVNFMYKTPLHNTQLKAKKTLLISCFLVH